MEFIKPTSGLKEIYSDVYCILMYRSNDLFIMMCIVFYQRINIKIFFVVN